MSYLSMSLGPVERRWSATLEAVLLGFWSLVGLAAVGNRGRHDKTRHYYPPGLVTNSIKFFCLVFYNQTYFSKNVSFKNEQLRFELCQL